MVANLEGFLTWLHKTITKASFSVGERCFKQLNRQLWQWLRQTTSRCPLQSMPLQLCYQLLTVYLQMLSKTQKWFNPALIFSSRKKIYRIRPLFFHFSRNVIFLAATPAYFGNMQKWQQKWSYRVPQSNPCKALGQQDNCSSISTTFINKLQI